MPMTSKQDIQSSAPVMEASTEALATATAAAPMVTAAGASKQETVDGPTEVHATTLVAATKTVLQPIATWTVEDVCQRLQDLNVSPACMEKFRVEGLDGQALMLLTAVCLKDELQLPLGERLKILQLIQSGVARDAFQ